MKRKEEIEQAANEAYIQHISNGGYGSKFDFVNGYIAGAEQADDAFIEKAVTYIAENMRCDGYTFQTKLKFIKAFKEFMKG